MTGASRARRERVLVTGGLGFLGTHLVQECRRRGAFVRVVDIASPRADWPFVNDPQVEVCQESVCDRRAMERAFHGMETVYHLAAIVGVRRVAENPARVFESNVAGARAVVGLCQELDRRLLFVSSSEIYGSGSRGQRFAETDSPGFDARQVRTDGRAAYAQSKWLGEDLCLTAARAGLRVAIARPFNAVGAGQSVESGALVPNLVENARRGRPILLEGNGSPTRAFTDAEELVQAFADLAASESALGQVVNVGSPAVHSLREIAEEIVALTGSSSPIVDAGGPIVAGVMPVSHRAPDLTRLRQVLGWVPIRPISRALARAANVATPVESAIAAG